MSEPTECSQCGDIYGASWGRTTALCPDCANGITKQTLKEEVFELREQNKQLQKELNKLRPKFLGEGI
jgi:hypothetical protein